MLNFFSTRELAHISLFGTLFVLLFIRSKKLRQSTTKLIKLIFEPKTFLILAVNNIDIELQLASEGLGMTFFGEFPLSQVHTTHPLACFSVGEPKTEFDFAVAYRNGMYISSVMRNCIDTSKEVLQKSVAK